MAEESVTIEVQEIVENVDLVIEDTAENVLIEIQEVQGPIGPAGADGATGPQGPPGDGAPLREILVGDIDGVNVTYTCTLDVLENSETVFINGLAQFPIEHYTVIDNIITLDEPAAIGDKLTITYVRR